MTTLEDLERRLDSPDINASGLALGELVAQGRAATPALARAMRSESANVRRLAMEGLGTVADPASLDDVRRGLQDCDGRVRSLAAVALNRLGAPDALQSLIATLDDWPDLAHSDMSRSTYELAASGPRALPVAISLLDGEDWATRAKGAWIIRTIVARDRDDPTLAELESLICGFDARAESAQEREHAVRAARHWLEDQAAR